MKETSTDTRERILVAAQRHLNQHPTASLAELAAAAGVGRATLHRYFAGRDDLLEELGARSIERWQQSLTQAGVDEAAAGGDAAAIRACLTDLLSRYVADSDDFGFTLTDSHLLSSSAHLTRTQELFDREVSFYTAAQRAGVLRDDLPPVWLGHAVYGLLVAAREGLRLGDLPRRGLEDLVLTTLLAGTDAS